MRTEPSGNAVALIATYNERENILLLVERLFALPEGLSVMVVDDASPDGTGAALRERFGKDPRLILVEREGKRGYGTAMIAGFERALAMGFERIVTLDADFSHDPADVPQLLQALDRVAVAIGSRYRDGVRVLNWPPRRLILSLFANAYVRRLLGLPFRDNTSGFRAYRRQVLESIDPGSLRSQGYAFLVEILYRALLLGWPIEEEPIVFTERREGQSKMSGGVIFESALAPWGMLLRKRSLIKRLRK
jgi:dolichol-phosphate mannosyltransferase